MCVSKELVHAKSGDQTHSQDPIPVHHVMDIITDTVNQRTTLAITTITTTMEMIMTMTPRYNVLAIAILGLSCLSSAVLGFAPQPTQSTLITTRHALKDNNNDDNIHHVDDNIDDHDSTNQSSLFSTTDGSSRRNFLSTTTTAALAMTTVSFGLFSNTPPASAKLESVNRPDLLPSESGLNVIQTEKFLTTGQARRMNDMLASLEKDTGYRVRLLCQNYPNTPGLAIRDYWDLGTPESKDDKYVVLVVDQFGGKGNALNFNVGDGMKFALPNIFWTRLQGKYGNTFFVRENGLDLAITNALEAIVSCLRSEEQYCVDVPAQGQSMRGLGM